MRPTAGSPVTATFRSRSPWLAAARSRAVDPKGPPLYAGTKDLEARFDIDRASKGAAAHHPAWVLEPRREASVFVLSAGPSPPSKDAAPELRPGERVRPGTVLAGRYRLDAIIGAGAFGVVWRARHVHLETECALKLFNPPVGADLQETGARFLQEARLMARLKCINVAQVFDYGVHEQMPFLVLELLQGRSLRSVLDELRQNNRRLTPAVTARIIRQVAEALRVAHAAQVVHRDLKPENIFLERQGDTHVAKVLDFGIAKWGVESAPQLTASHIMMGTAHYMSPEQFENARSADHRSDLWSLAVIAFECLTGELPFPGETLLDVAFRVCKEGPRSASQLAWVPPGFDAWFRRATAVERELRFDSALEQARALRELCEAAEPPAQLAQPAPQLQGALGQRRLSPWRERLAELQRHPHRYRIAAAAATAILFLSIANGMCASAVVQTAPAASAALVASATEVAVAGDQPASHPAVTGETTVKRPGSPGIGKVRARPAATVQPSPGDPVQGQFALTDALGGGASSGPGLDATAIQRTVRKYSPTVRQECWQRALQARAPGVPSSAKVIAQITVHSSGRVDSVIASGAPRGYPGLAACIEKAIKRWSFPRSFGETVTNVPFMFVGQ